MAGSLIKIDEEIVSSAVASVTLTGIDSTYDVYKVVFSGIELSANAIIRARVTESGTANTTSNYDYAHKYLKSASAFGTNDATNSDKWNITATNDSTQIGHSASLYLFNFNNSSEYSFATIESTFSGNGFAGGGVFTSTSSCNGIQFILSTGNYEAGTFTLYGLKK